MAIVHWEPFSLRPWSRWPRMWEEEEFWPEEFEGRGLDVYETDNEVVVEAPVPGVPEDKVEVSIEGDLITITGAVEEEKEEDKKKTYYRKTEKRSFCYTTSSPRPIKSDEATAEVKDGVVTVRIPKVEEAKPKKVTVKPKGK